MNPLLGVAIYVILWWLSFFVMLPVGAQSPHEAGETVEPGSEVGAPKVHNVRKKALWAAGIAAVLWLFVFWAVSVDLFGMRPH
jgi:predicted secreted protein